MLSLSGILHKTTKYGASFMAKKPATVTEAKREVIFVLLGGEYSKDELEFEQPIRGHERSGTIPNFDPGLCLFSSFVVERETMVAAGHVNK